MTASAHVAPLDELDRSLLSSLQQHGRATLRELANQVHLGVSATRVRLQQLQTSGVIEGFTARVSSRALGYNLRAVVRMKVHGSLFDQVMDVLSREPQIVRCLRVTGEFCYVMEIVALDMADLERITSALAKVGSITTDLIYEVVRDGPAPTTLALQRSAR